jgi:hypothetical protein
MFYCFQFDGRIAENEKPVKTSTEKDKRFKGNK